LSQSHNGFCYGRAGGLCKILDEGLVDFQKINGQIF